MGDLLCTHYARPYTKFLTLPIVCDTVKRTSATRTAPLPLSLANKFDAYISQFSPTYCAGFPSTVVKEKLKMIGDICSALHNQPCSTC